MSNKVPMHVQLRDLIREKIEEGEFKYGELIPSERELASMYGLSRMTVRNAISALVNDGLLKKVHGKGTFVTKPKIGNDLYKLQGFGQMLLEKGITPSTKLLYSGKRKAGYKYASIFNINEEDYIYRIVRLRLGDNEPISLEDTYVPYNIVKGIEQNDFQVHSLYDLFEVNDIKLSTGYETLTIVKVRRSEAKLLNVVPGSSVFLLENISLDTDKRVIEFTRSYVSGEKCSFYNDLV